MADKDNVIKNIMGKFTDDEGLFRGGQEGRMFGRAKDALEGKKNTIGHNIAMSLSGVSKTNLLRSFKESYNLSDQEVTHILQLCRFKKAPEWINYDAFYNNPIAEKAVQIKYPFTQIYSYKNFLTAEECSTLIG